MRNESINGKSWAKVIRTAKKLRRKKEVDVRKRKKGFERKEPKHESDYDHRDSYFERLIVNSFAKNQNENKKYMASCFNDVSLECDKSAESSKKKSGAGKKMCE